MDPIATIERAQRMANRLGARVGVIASGETYLIQPVDSCNEEDCLEVCAPIGNDHEPFPS